MPTDVSLWADSVGRSGIVSGRWVLLVSRVLTGHPLLACKRHPSYNSHVTMFGIRATFHVTVWLRNRKVWAMRDWSCGRRNIVVLDMVLVPAIYSFLVCVIFSFPPDYWNGKWHNLPFTIPSFPQVLHTCFTAKVGSEWLILIPSFDSKVIAICLLHKVCDFCLTIRKNHITTHITEPVIQISSWKERKISTQLIVETWQSTLKSSKG